MTKRYTVIVTLRRRCKSQPWGISIAGGADFNSPIVVTRSENDDLQKGDVIKKIDEYDMRDIRHVDAQYLLQNSDSIRLVVERQKSDANPHILPKSPIPPPSPIDVDNRSYSPNHYEPRHDYLDEVREERIFLSQPYRTTPLVLPGAKIKKDAPLGECYLRHHPNPLIRAAPHHYDALHPDVAMKQKVADSVLQRVLGPEDMPKVVSKQFNSPIGLYSDQNIADTIKCQASAIPVKRPVKYDPSKSEAYKALQEEQYDEYSSYQEVTQPSRTGVFSPEQARHSRPPPISQRNPSSYINVTDGDGEKIHQSNSFKRIMFSVLGQTDY